MSLIDRVRIQSHVAENTTYVVTLVDGEAVACTCPHFHHRADSAAFECKHMRNAIGVQALRELLSTRG